MPDTLPLEDSRLRHWMPAAPPVALRAVRVRQPMVDWALSSWSAAAQPTRSRLSAATSTSSTAPATASVNADAFDKLISAAVHDVRNSLSAVRLGVELLARRGHPREPDAVLMHVDSAADRAIERSQELADVCRLAAGKQLDIATQRFCLHTVIRQAIDALAPSPSDAGAGSAAISVPVAAGTVFEHDRLGEGECSGDPARIAQFLNLAFEELASAVVPARVIVVSEVFGDRFRIAICEGAATAEPLGDDRPEALLSRARRRLLLHGIAGAHRGGVEFGDAQGRPSVEGSFHSVRRGAPRSD